ncbi:Levanase [subsurface metagenome]
MSISFWTELREKLAADPQRPRYHFLPPANWMNDPNGPLFWKGKYHIFYQHNPYAAFHGGRTGTMHWGHAFSEDLVYWKHLPVALAPTPDGPDKNGIYTGCAVDNSGVPTIIYTGVSPEVQCIATSNDDMITWKKHDRNPVIDSPPKDLEVTGFRDPCVWKEKDDWYMLIGSGIKGIGGTCLLYRSKDLIAWEYLHPLCIGDGKNTGDMWECPDFFPLGNKHVLLVSVLRRRWNPCFIGEYIDHKFQPRVQRNLDLSGNLDIGGCFYAAKSMADSRGRRILFGWILEGRSASAQWASGWSGVLSLPRMLSLHEDSTLRMEPVTELKVLRGKHYQYKNLHVTTTSSSLLKDIQGDCLEIIAQFDPEDAKEFGLKVRCAPDGTEQTLIFYNNASKSLNVNRERSSLTPEVNQYEQGGPFELASDETLKLHIFMDRSVIEVFANDQVCLTSRIYPSRTNSLGIGLFARGGSVKLKSIDIWEMRSIWE